MTKAVVCGYANSRMLFYQFVRIAARVTLKSL